MGFVVSGTMYVCHNKLRKLKWQEWRAKSRAPEGRKERDLCRGAKFAFRKFRVEGLGFFSLRFRV